MSRAKVPHRIYTAEFKTEAVRLAREVGVTCVSSLSSMLLSALARRSFHTSKLPRNHAIGQTASKQACARFPAAAHRGR